MLLADTSATVLCPAKINLNLAVHGLREDGFHALSSVVAQTALGDELKLDLSVESTMGQDVVIVDGAVIPEAENTVLKALRQFRLASGFKDGFFTANLSKRIPIGAGLGGGSSDAAGTLKALKALLPELADKLDWASMAAAVGSDCPLFLEEAPVLMEGRGEIVSPLDSTLAARIQGLPLILFKPRFPVDTGEAYRRLAAGSLYTPREAPGQWMREWMDGSIVLPEQHNDFERLMETWMPSLTIVLQRLRERHGLDARLSGSGSACFAFPRDQSSDISFIREEMERAWGECHWLEATALK